MINNFIFSLKFVVLTMLPLIILTMLELGIMAYLVIYIPYPLIWVIVGIILFFILLVVFLTWIKWLLECDIL